MVKLNDYTCFSLDLFWAFTISNPFFAVFFWELPAIPPLTHRTMHLSHCHSSRSRSPDGKGFTSSEHNRNNTCNLDRTSSWSQQQQHLTFTKSDCGTQSTQVDAMFRNSHPKHWGWAHFSSAAPRHDVWLLSSPVLRGLLVQDANWIELRLSKKIYSL